MPNPLTLLSALLVTLSFPPYTAWPLIWVCLIPWFWALSRSQSLRESALQGFWLGYLLTLSAFYWVAYVLQEFGGLPWAISILGLLLFAVISQPQFFLFSLFFYGLRLLEDKEKERRYGFLCFCFLVLALLYAALDWILPKLFVDTLGHAFFKARNLRQLADIGGAALLTFLAVLGNLTLWALLRWKRFLFWPVLVTLALCLSGWGYGHWKSGKILGMLQAPKKWIQLAAIQGNIGDFDKLSAEGGSRQAAYKVIETFTQMSDQALGMTPPPEVLIWPETAFPSTFRNPKTSIEFYLNQQVEEYVQKKQIPLLFGGYDHTEGKDYNAFFLLSAAKEAPLQIYRKNILLTFGEYIPGSDTFTIIKEIFPQVGNFGRGPGPEVFDLPLLSAVSGVSGSKTVRLSPVICYEALFTDYSVAAARKGSELIVNITNDSWFGSWGEPQLHLALTAFRSIETHLPMIRTTNTGISALILPDGEITHATSLGKAEILNVSVPIVGGIPSLIVNWGDWFGPFATVLGGLGYGLLFRWRRSQRKA